MFISGFFLSGCAEMQEKIQQAQEKQNAQQAEQFSYETFKQNGCRNISYDGGPVGKEQACWKAYNSWLDNNPYRGMYASAIQKAKSDGYGIFMFDMKNAQDRMTAEKQRFENQRSQNTRDEQNAFSERIAAIKSGKTKFKTVAEAQAVYSATPGGRVVTNPLIKPDGKLYTVQMNIDASETESSNSLTLTGTNILTGETAYARVKFPKGIPNGFSVGDSVVIVGKYVANQKYTTIGKQSKTMPVFEIVAFERG